jgi:hypothetical protein
MIVSITTLEFSLLARILGGTDGNITAGRFDLS